MGKTLDKMPLNDRDALAQQLRLAVICDYLEEERVSMDFCAEMIMSYLRAEHNGSIQFEQILPEFRRRFGRLPWLGKKRSAFTIDLTLNCFWDYPRYLRRRLAGFDVFHIADHSYAQLVHVLPPERTGVFCHDIDAFRTLLEPEKYPGSIRYNTTQANVLRGFQKAAVVFYTTTEVRRQIEHYQLLDPSRLVQAPLGIAPEFSPVPQSAGSTDQRILERVGERPFVLSVSSSRQRKRVDVLLEVFAAVRAQYPDLRLVRVGRVDNDWMPSHREQINRLGISEAIVYVTGLKRTALAELYRRAALVLVTSEIEGFCLPVIEALACGSIVVASDIPVLREVGEPAVVYCPVADIPAWTKTVEQLLSSPTTAPDRALRLAQAAKYSWSNHARIIAQAYSQLGTTKNAG